MGKASIQVMHWVHWAVLYGDRCMKAGQDLIQRGVRVYKSQKILGVLMENSS